MAAHGYRRYTADVDVFVLDRHACADVVRRAEQEGGVVAVDALVAGPIGSKLARPRAGQPRRERIAVNPRWPKTTKTKRDWCQREPGEGDAS